MKRNIMNKIRAWFLVFSVFVAYNTASADTLHLSLHNAIKIAQDSSLMAFNAKTNYQSSYWAYKSYKSSLLPSLDLNVSPIDYDKSINRVLNLVDTTYISIENENLSSDISLQLNQDIVATGGRLSVISNVRRFEDLINDDKSFMGNPIFFAYSQPLMGYNPLKWMKKIEPMRFEQAKVEFVYEREQIALETVTRYFQLILAKKQLDIARQNIVSADSLLVIAKKRFEIGTVNKTEILTLEYDLVRSKTIFKQSMNRYKRANSDLAVLLRLDKNTVFVAAVPFVPASEYVNAVDAVQMAYEYNQRIKSYGLEIVNRESAVVNARSQRYLSASEARVQYGLNKNAESLPGVYEDPNSRRSVGLSFSIPLVNWGEKREEHKITLLELESTLNNLEQEKNTLEQNVTLVVNDFNIQEDVVANALLAKSIANEAYALGKVRFVNGGIDVNNLYILRGRQMNAEVDYISQIHSYWELYYQLRLFTLYDFNGKKPLGYEFSLIE